MTRASPDALIELHCAAQAFLTRRSTRDAEARERFRRALRQVLKERNAEIPPDLAEDGVEAFALLHQHGARCHRFGVPWDKVAAIVNREWNEERNG